jgi:acyl-CoA reductase-like NAD-dependent aldehyde dehydrogenase
VVLTPSEAAPLTTRAPAEIIADAGLPAGAFNLVSGDGPVVGHRIAAHPDVGLVSFTGSTAAGVQVSIAAAESIIAATVERFEVGDPTAESTNHGGREAARRRARGTGKPVAWLLRPADGVHEVAPDARIVREEVFGPVLVVQVYETVEKAVELANATEHSLSAGVWAPERPVRRLQAFRGRPRVRPVRPGGVPGDQVLPAPLTARLDDLAGVREFS